MRLLCSAGLAARHVLPSLLALVTSGAAPPGGSGQLPSAPGALQVLCPMRQTLEQIDEVFDSCSGIQMIVV